MQFLSLSLLIPIAYLGILVGSLATFSHLYRQRQLNAKLRLAPYFPPHQARNVYLSLMHLPDQDPSNNSTVKVPDSVLRAALLNRAVEDIYRIMEVRTRKNPLNQLLQRGVVGDEMWQRLLRAEQELEVELKDVVAEANALAPGWGQTIFQSASEMAQNRRLKESLTSIQATIPTAKLEWEQQRERSRRELEDDSPEDGTTTSAGKKDITSTSTSTTALPTTSTANSTTTIPNAEKSNKATVDSDEDGVIVDTPGSTTTGGGSASKNKKKKGKK